MAQLPAQAQIQGIGARCPLGISPLPIAMCARARKAEPQSIAWRDKRDNPIGFCLTPGLPPTLTGYDRLLALAAPALKEAMAGAGQGGMTSIPIALALSEAGGPHHAEWAARDTVADLATLSGIGLDRKRSVVLYQGRAGGALALEAAIGLMVQQGEKHVLWGGADTFLHEGRLKALDQECRLMSLGTENGFIPSEGAAFVLLSRTEIPAKDASLSKPFGSIVGVDNEREETIPKNEPNIAKALTNVLRKAHDRIGGKIPWVLSDLNGERHSTREWQFAASRGSFAEACVHSRFIDDLGEVGAAAGPLLATIACMYFRAGCAPSRVATIALQSDGINRGAFVIAAEETAP